MDKRRRAFLYNGSNLLEDIIASCDGKSNPIRNYSASELIRATTNFDPSYVIREDGFYHMFKGFLEDQGHIIVKKFMGTDAKHGSVAIRDFAIRDIVVSMQMSNHKNVLKLLGCCLEFPTPALVHEYASNGVIRLQEGFGNDEPVSWRVRLRIAKQVANAVTYLHTAFPRPIIHRNLKLTKIFLDEDYVAKLCDFSQSITIPPKQSYVEADFVIGTLGYLDPTYMHSFFITESTDVYSFGVLLLMFLTGREAIIRSEEGKPTESLVQYVNSRASDGQIDTIVDPKVLNEVKEEGYTQQHLHDFLALALSCIDLRSEARPDMIDVAKELVRIEKCMWL